MPASARRTLASLGWCCYLPWVYLVHLRGTGESVAANIGGRLIGTSFAYITATLAVTSDRVNAPTEIALVTASIGVFVYAGNFAASFWLPEPTDQFDKENSAGVWRACQWVSTVTITSIAIAYPLGENR
jgi:hypothetical protein